MQGFDSPILKPDWSPDFFLSCNYLCHMIFLRRDLVRAGWRDFDRSLTAHKTTIFSCASASEPTEFIIFRVCYTIGGGARIPARATFARNLDSSKLRGAQLKVT